MRDLRKSFSITSERRTTLRELVAYGRAPAAERVDALRGVSLDVRAGEFLGIVGRNGSGKSTLLRLVAGIYGPDEGEIVTQGQVSSFIEMGVGFRAELSARNNVLLSGVVLGVPERETRERLPDVLAFADLEGFAEQKLKNFSSGMGARLAFASALHVRADIILLDEVLAVGDEAFQAKCHGEFERLKAEGRTVLFVTHDMDAVERFCDRAVLLEGGVVAAEGKPEEVAEAYHALNRAPVPPRPVDEHPAAPVGRRIDRTAVFGSDPRRVLRLASAFARADLSEHYQDSILGYLWAVLRPLSLFLVLLLVLSPAANLAAGVEAYPVYLLTAIMVWGFFAETTSSGLLALAGAQATLRRTRLPLLSLPLAAVLKATFNLAANFVVVVIFAVVYGLRPRLTWLELPLLMALLAVFALGLTLLLSALYVHFRDTTQVWTVTLQFLFYASPIVYVAGRLPASLQDVLNLSPLSAVFSQMRHAVIDPSAPTAAELAGGTGMLVVPAAIVCVVLAAGLWLFAREAPRMAERL